MYYPYFIAYMAAGFIISLVVFFWALNSGQFKDQQRARFLPLQNDLDLRAFKPLRY
jgi:cbb3-type cytochrome oxidase maturation protein